MIDAAERVTGKKVPVKYGERRSGEPAVLIASSDPITRELGWKPQLQSLDEIIASAWRRRQHRKR